MPTDEYSRMDSSGSESSASGRPTADGTKDSDQQPPLLFGTSPGAISMASTSSSRNRTDSEDSAADRHHHHQLDEQHQQTRFVLPGTGTSPAKVLTLDQVQQALTNIDNMTLAHEIAVNPDFRLKPYEPAANTLERNIKDMVHRAFWAAIREQLAEDPPSYDHAIQLLADIKDGFAHILTANNQKALDRIGEVLDATVIRQQAERGVLDFRSYANFIVQIMARSCAPVRDEAVAALSSIEDVLDMFRGILEVMELMKLDMANCMIESARKVVMQHSIEYEKKCFREHLDVYTGAFPATEAWLLRHKPEDNGGSGGSSGTNTNTSADAAIRSAFVELLQQHGHPYPETVNMDRERIDALAVRCLRLGVCASVEALTNSLPAIAGQAAYREKLRRQVTVLLESVRDEESLSHAIEGVWLQVREVLRSTPTPLDAGTEEALRVQVMLLADRTSPVRAMMIRRLVSYAGLVVSKTQSTAAPPPPPGFADFVDELELFVSFRRIMFYNYMVFGDFYHKVLSGEVASQSAVSDGAVEGIGGGVVVGDGNGSGNISA